MTAPETTRIGLEMSFKSQNIFNGFVSIFKSSLQLMVPIRFQIGSVSVASMTEPGWIPVGSGCC